MNEDAEWLEADVRGGFASGTSRISATRKYHGLHVVSKSSVADRVMLVNGVVAWLHYDDGRVRPLTSHSYVGIDSPNISAAIRSFSHSPWPTWTLALSSGEKLTYEIVRHRERETTLLRWRFLAHTRGATLCVRPLLSGRDIHGLHQENAGFSFVATPREDGVEFQPYSVHPPIHVSGNCTYHHEPQWYRSFYYSEEAARGYQSSEDLGSPGVFKFSPDEPEFVLSFGPSPDPQNLPASATTLIYQEHTRRAAFQTPEDQAAEDFIVLRGEGKTIVAGYPWFTDWGRDTFIALRGLVLAQADLITAREVLYTWLEHLSDGMIPNRFPEYDLPPEYNSVDASLWFILSVGTFINMHSDRAAAWRANPELARTVQTIVDAYVAGTRFGIRIDTDGLCACGLPWTQLTWMDARIESIPVTPRTGKPVEISALWLNALSVVAELEPRFQSLLDRGTLSFRTRFWNSETGCLYDVVDVDHISGTADASIRPNQIFAAGGLPYSPLTPEAAQQVVAVVEQNLVTPAGLRTLTPRDPRYRGRYSGSVEERDSAYHQGTVWPWLMGAFVDAWIKAKGDTAENRERACTRFVAPLRAHFRSYGGHIPEIADGDAPHTPRGCPFQAWSLAEYLRIKYIVQNG